MQVWHCQLAVALVQTSFVVGSVYLKRSFQQLHDGHFHPIIFALTREAVRAATAAAQGFRIRGRRVRAIVFALSREAALQPQSQRRAVGLEVEGKMPPSSLSLDGDWCSHSRSGDPRPVQLAR